MKVSTRGRYALRTMLDLAQNGGEGAVALKDIARRQEISVKYLELIMAGLSKGGLVRGTRGKAGGYRLAVAPSACTVGAVLKLAEGSLAPVACLADGECARAGDCVALPMWRRLDQVIDEYLESVTLQDLLDQAAAGDA